MNKKGKPKGSTTPIKLIMIMLRNPLITNKELKVMGYNPYTIRRYRNKILIAEKELLGLI